MSTNLDIRTKLISLVSDDAGKLTLYTPTIWTANTVYALNTRVKPTSYKSRTYKCTTIGTSHATAQPTWPESSGATVTDGTVTWTEESDDYDRHILGALDLFSKSVPATLVVSVTGNGTSSYAVPTGWIDELSTILFIEYPISEIPPSYLFNDRYMIFQSTSTIWKIMLFDETPTSSETFKVTFTAKRDATNIPDGLLEPFVWLAGALCLLELSTKAVNYVDSSINADSVNYESKDEQYSEKVRQLMKMYRDSIGILEGFSKGAIYITQRDTKYPYGISRLTHSRAERRTR